VSSFAPKKSFREDRITARTQGNKSDFDGKKCLEKLQDLLARAARREQEELAQDVIAGNADAIAAKVALEALNGPVTTNRQREIQTHNVTWRTWREGRSPSKA